MRSVWSLLLYLSFLLGCMRGEAKVYVTFNIFVDPQGVSKHKIHQRHGNQLLAFFQAYVLAKQVGATLLVPDHLDIPLMPYLKAWIDAEPIGILKADHGRIKNNCRQISGQPSLPHLAPYRGDQEHLLIRVGANFEDMTWLRKQLVEQGLQESLCALLESMTQGAYFPLGAVDSGELRVGIHYRNGMGFDRPLASKQLYDATYLATQQACVPFDQRPLSNIFLDVVRPFKVPPLQYSLDALELWMEQHPQEPFRLYFFTDHLQPQQVLASFLDALGDKKEQIASVTHIDTSSMPKNVQELVEILWMRELDVLIRPRQSTFSMIASTLRCGQETIVPKQMEWMGDCLVVQEVEWEQGDRTCHRHILRDAQGCRVPSF